MIYGNYFNKKYKQYRNKTWSAPMLMSVFIIISMFLVFSFEQIGIFRKESNLGKTAVHIGKSKNYFFIKLVQQGKNKNIEKISEKMDLKESLKTKVTNESKIIKEKNQEKMMNDTYLVVVNDKRKVMKKGT